MTTNEVQLHYQAMVDGLSAYATVIGSDYRWIAFNSRYQTEFENLFGKAPVIGDSVAERLPEGDERNRVLNAFERALSGEKFDELIEFGGLGEKRSSYQHTYGPLAGPDGKIFACFMFAREVPNPSKTEQELQKVRERFDRLFSYAPIGMVLVSPDGKMLRSNRALANILGYDPHILATKSFQEITHPEDLDRDLALLKQLAAGEIDSYRMEKRYFHKDGHIVWAILSVSKIPGPSGKPLLYISQIQDVSAAKQHEKLLMEARDEALSAATAKSNFLAVMSHEIRTPMNAIIGFAELLGSSNLDSEQSDWLKQIYTAGEHLLLLIDEILDFSRIESGSIEISNEAIDLNRTIEDSLSLMRPRALDKNLTLEFKPSPEVSGKIISDPMRIRQILVNLVGNALKFTHKGGVRVEVMIADDGTTAPWAKIQVADTGIGIAKDAQEKIFEPFAQADSSTSRVYGGTGLGLAITQKLLQSMGGELTVQSETGEGSVFTVAMPLRLAGARQEEIEKADVEQIRKLRFLLVDDIEANNELIAKRLSALGAQVTKASSSEEVSRILAGGQRFDFVLTDLMMPGSDGFQIARIVTDKFGRDRPHLIMVSSLPRHAIPKRPELREFDSILVKPIPSEILRNTILRILGRNSISAAMAASAKEEGRTQTFAEECPAEILVAEDKPSNLILLEAFLKKLGYPPPRVAKNGFECVEAFREKPADLILMDIRMPKMDGLEAASRIFALEEESPHPLSRKGRGVGIIAITADAMQGDREAALSAGMHDYLMKPIKLPALRRAMRSILKVNLSPEI